MLEKSNTIAKNRFTVAWEMLAVENFGESANKVVGEKYFGKMTIH